MAGGIDWFRWHHGSTNDPKFRLVAKRACARLGDVLAMWAMLLEQSSASEDRGNPGNLDFEAIDLALDMEDGAAEAIHTAMVARDLIDAETGRVLSWEKRQPKRERPDDNSTERSRDHRAKKRTATPEDGDATPSNAKQHQETPRGEESREEKNSSSLRSEGAPRKRAAALPAPDDVDPQVWSDWLQLRKDKRATVTSTVVDSARDEASKAGMTLETFLRVWCARGSQGLQADWLKPSERNTGPPPSKQSALEARNAAAAARILENLNAAQRTSEVP